MDNEDRKPCEGGHALDPDDLNGPGSITFMYDAEFDELNCTRGEYYHSDMDGLQNRQSGSDTIDGRLGRAGEDCTVISIWCSKGNQQKVISILENLVSYLRGHFPNYFSYHGNYAVCLTSTSGHEKVLSNSEVHSNPEKCRKFFWWANKQEIQKRLKEIEQEDAPECPKLDFQRIMAGLHTGDVSQKAVYSAQVCAMAEPDEYDCPNSYRQWATMNARVDCDKEDLTQKRNIGIQKAQYRQQQLDYIRNFDTSTSWMPGTPLYPKKKDLDRLYFGEWLKNHEQG